MLQLRRKGDSQLETLIFCFAMEVTYLCLQKQCSAHVVDRSHPFIQQKKAL